MDTNELLNKLASELPSDVKEAVSTFQMHKLASVPVDFSAENGLGKLAYYVGCKLAERQARWRPVCDGLIALQQLREE